MKIFCGDDFDVQNMWFHPDGATCHKGKEIKDVSKMRSCRLLDYLCFFCTPISVLQFKNSESSFNRAILFFYSFIFNQNLFEINLSVKIEIKYFLSKLT